MTRAIPLILLLLAACTPGAEEPQANQSGAPAAENRAAAAEEQAQVPSLAGDWEVTTINGRELTQAYDMGASVTDDRFTIRSECVRMAWDYQQDRNIVTFTPAPVDSCERFRTNNEQEVEGVVELSNIAIFSDDGREVTLSGPGGRLTMTRR